MAKFNFLTYSLKDEISRFFIIVKIKKELEKEKIRKE